MQTICTLLKKIVFFDSTSSIEEKKLLIFSDSIFYSEENFFYNKQKTFESPLLDLTQLLNDIQENRFFHRSILSLGTDSI